MNNFIRSYNIILHQFKELQINATLFKQIRLPKLSNIELVAMNFTAEYMGIDSECQLFRTIENSFLDQPKIELQYIIENIVSSRFIISS